MKRSMLLLAVLAVTMLGFGRAQAHECTYDGEERGEGNQVECHESPAAPNWRDGNYVPLFDLEDRDDGEQRKDAQRWRDECSYYREDGSYESNQNCAWVDAGNSTFPRYGEDGPNEMHAGFAASHCFLFEFAHDCSDHDARYGESVHDKHGGATYVDVCLASQHESKYCDDGMTDTQVGLTIMDHNACGVIVPIVACIDEYHVIRPFDQAYTEEQMADSQEYIPRILEDPELYLCGYQNRRGSGNPICPGEGDGPLPGDGGPDMAPADVARAQTVALRTEAVRRLLAAGVPMEMVSAALARVTAAEQAAQAGATGWGSITVLLAALALLVARRARVHA
ncbi:MAG TPA: hypothetical protein VGB52_10000 [Actinomycetota bacterium]|jgi:hypothetical protein